MYVFQWLLQVLHYIHRTCHSILMLSFHQFESSVENRWVVGVEGLLLASVGIQGGELSLLPVEVKV